MKIGVFFLLLQIGFSISVSSTIHHTNNRAYFFKVDNDYNDPEIFWADFKKFAKAKNYKKITEMTYFPFGYQNTTYTREQFKDFSFTDDFIKTISRMKFPKKSKSTWTIKEKPVPVWEIYTKDTSLYFCQIGGQWKFVGVLYGD
jgi:hypothetical protein